MALPPIRPCLDPYEFARFIAVPEEHYDEIRMHLNKLLEDRRQRALSQRGA